MEVVIPMLLGALLGAIVIACGIAVATDPGPPLGYHAELRGMWPMTAIVWVKDA